MKISKELKKVVLGNIELIKYCNEVGIDLEKLAQCRIERIGKGEALIFALSKENVPKSTQLIPLDFDLDSQPDIVLIMHVTENDIFFDVFDETRRVLNIK